MFKMSKRIASLVFRQAELSPGAAPLLAAGRGTCTCEAHSRVGEGHFLDILFLPGRP
ncbi:hypothetical protein [Desulfofustis limnaeus]|jgi:hypothetical protein|uniref:hypothetical protein n=1 Tax=Desulfofustis limnaeus TaxID=2740163 RepID=UPI0024DF6C5E|nr:hypothetical protein [Desulfofustis limnaeus]MDX9895316.1 hypothetical protein [Desulfofustis sp.]